MTVGPSGCFCPVLRESCRSAIHPLRSYALQFDTLRLRPIKLAVRVADLKRRIKPHLPTSTPDQAIFALVLGRLPRLTV